LCQHDDLLPARPPQRHDQPGQGRRADHDPRPPDRRHRQPPDREDHHRCERQLVSDRHAHDPDRLHRPDQHVDQPCRHGHRPPPRRLRRQRQHLLRQGNRPRQLRRQRRLVPDAERERKLAPTRARRHQPAVGREVPRHTQEGPHLPAAHLPPTTTGRPRLPGRHQPHPTRGRHRPLTPLPGRAVAHTARPLPQVMTTETEPWYRRPPVGSASVANSRNPRRMERTWKPTIRTPQKPALTYPHPHRFLRRPPRLPKRRSRIETSQNGTANNSSTATANGSASSKTSTSTPKPTSRSSQQSKKAPSNATSPSSHSPS